jgi:hypothetical protein
MLAKIRILLYGIAGIAMGIVLPPLIAPSPSETLGWVLLVVGMFIGIWIAHFININIGSRFKKLHWLFDILAIMIIIGSWFLFLVIIGAFAQPTP